MTAAIFSSAVTAQVTVDVLLKGDFAATYETGDNSKVVPTDTIKNTVYFLAKEGLTAKRPIGAQTALSRVSRVVLLQSRLA